MQEKMWMTHTIKKKESKVNLKHLQGAAECFTFTMRLPWMPMGSWLMLMAILFCRMVRAPLLMVRRSLDMNKGAAIMAHSAIWERDWSMLRPKSPTTSCGGQKPHNQGRRNETLISRASKHQQKKKGCWSVFLHSSEWVLVWLEGPKTSPMNVWITF